ncbi:MAG TPA: radical SAM protein, partial [Bacteroidetes bacterium]|nr:radical SAM protein [Bacteroidota bacterium]
MKIVAKTGRSDLAVVYIAETENGGRVEFVESLEPPHPRGKKWVNIVSTLYGCPIRCTLCDAGRSYRGRLSAGEMLFQIDHLVRLRFPDGTVPSEKWKIQFARMGEPALNPDVVKVLELLPERYHAPGLMPSISTVAPGGTDRFFETLLRVKSELYPDRFQFQFSLHSTSPAARERLIPVRCWTFGEMARYGERFHATGGRKITLNFALIDRVPVEPKVLREYFDPGVFLVKVTPLNPTCRASENGLKPLAESDPGWRETIDSLESAGYEV